MSFYFVCRFFLPYVLSFKIILSTFTKENLLKVFFKIFNNFHFNVKFYIAVTGTTRLRKENKINPE